MGPVFFEEIEIPAFRKGGFIETVRIGIEAAKPGAGEDNEVSGFEFLDGQHIIVRELAVITGIGKEVEKMRTVKAAQAFIGAKPHKSAAILTNAGDTVVSQPIS